MRESQWTLRLLALGCVAYFASCGGGNGGGGDAGNGADNGPDATGDVPDGAGPGECTTDKDCEGKFTTLGPCEKAFCNLSGGGVCAKRSVEDGTVCDDGDSCTTGDRCVDGVCVPQTTCECRGDGDCKEKFQDLGPCETYFCNRSIEGGTCGRRPIEDETPCDDGNACTEGDSCKAGQCAPGATNVCDCLKNEDCAAFEDGNLCNGTLRCNLEHFPYKCVVDPSTVVTCDASADTFCLKNLCDPSTGDCTMTPVHEGEKCEDNSVCTTVSTCQGGQCAPFETILCDDENPCTDNTCDPLLGCVFPPNDDPCDDQDACTAGDRCVNGSCTSGEPVRCDDGLFCNGPETCDSEVGCVAGDPPDCNDDNPCTQDWCDGALNECRHMQLETAKEGPMGSWTCSDHEDNDCDHLVDADDPECHFGLVAVEPARGPAAGGHVVSLLGSALTMTKGVVFGGEPVPFEVRSAVEIVVTTPPHDPGDVDVSVTTGWITFTLPNAYRYTGASPQTDLTVTFVAPSSHEMSEGDTVQGIQVTLAVEGLGDGETADPNRYLAEVGYGLRGTLPSDDPSWTWSPLAVEAVVGHTISYRGALTVDIGGYLDMAARVSSDGGYTFVYGDLDGSGNGYHPQAASPLTVWGVPRPGAIVVNELMWMGSNENPHLPSPTYDEWFELRNMSRAPYYLGGYRLTGAAMQGADLVLDDAVHTVHNLVIEPFGYFLVMDYPRAFSMVDVDPDVVTNTKMLLPNQAPWTYELVAPNGTKLDVVKFSGLVGYNGDPNLGTPDRSMERNAIPGDGREDQNWHTANWHEGWDGDPFQTQNWGTPGGPNSDIVTCAADSDCAQAFPDLVLTACQKKVCLPSIGRCSVGARKDGESCEDGLFCTVGDICNLGTCSGTPRDCEEGNLCTTDLCDEHNDMCIHAAKDCHDLNECTADSCDPATGVCEHRLKDCADQNLCTVDWCDSATGECHNDPVDCDDDNACTQDSCNPDDGLCRNLWISCGDGDPCTADSCDPATGCLHDPIPGCTGCDEDEDCTDATRCTVDRCVNGVCVHEPVDCNDNKACTLDSCDPVSGDCVHELIPDAKEGPAGHGTCTDGVDNDCDDLTDGDDPQCLLAIHTVFPKEYPSGSSLPITLTGAGFAIVTQVFIGQGSASTPLPFLIQNARTIVAEGPDAPLPTGDYHVAVTDGVVTATLPGGFRVIDKDLALWGNTQWPTGSITTTAGQPTELIFGQVYAAGITDAGGDPSLIRAELGYGPAGSHPFQSPEWVFVPASFNPACLACGNNYEYMATLVVPAPGQYAVAFRYSVDGGYHWAYGDTDGWHNGWDPNLALTLIVNP